MNQYLLEMKDICKEFPGVRALNHVDFGLHQGEVHVLLGENGAGKSTLMKILSGAYPKTSGEIRIDGNPVMINGPRDAFRHGISMIYQEFNLNPHAPIYENIFLGREPIGKGGFIARDSMIAATAELCERVGLSRSPTTLVKELSVAEKQLVEIAKAVAFDSKIMILDEPTATLTEAEIAKLFGIIRSLKAKGVGIIYISHRLSELREIGDRCTVLRDGESVGTVGLDQVTEDDLIRMMVGRKVELSRRDKSYATDNVALSVRDLSYGELLKEISFDLYKGEILGVSGLVGSGRTELAKCIIGDYSRSAGEIYIGGQLVKINSPAEAIRHGIVYLSEDRKGEGLILIQDVKKNICLPALEKVLTGGLINEKEENRCASELVDQLDIRTPSISTPVKNLSGGNQQKTVVAKWLFSDASVYIFDEPTLGIDVGAREEVYSIMEELVENGSSILMISSDLVEILKMSDRVLVMCEGRAVTMLENNTSLTQEEILGYEIGEYR